MVMSLPVFSQNEQADTLSTHQRQITNMAAQTAKVAQDANVDLMDVNGDGAVNVVDLVDIIRYVRGEASTAFKKDKADFNYDGVVDSKDADLFSKVLTGGELPSGATAPELKGDSVKDPQMP